jgi:drug/metabolite transporter (DMT)-like permease
MLGCVVSWVTYTIFSRPLIREIGSINAVFYSVLTGTIMLFFAALMKGDLTVKNLLNLGLTQIICLSFLGIFWIGVGLCLVLQRDRGNWCNTSRSLYRTRSFIRRHLWTGYFA